MRIPRVQLRVLIIAAIVVACGLFMACGGSTKLDESLTSLKVGDCIGPGGEGNVSGIQTVDCGTDGALVVLKLFDMPDAGAFPGDDAVGAAASGDNGCPNTTVQYLGPTKASWEKAGDRQVICLATVDVVGSPAPSAS